MVDICRQQFEISWQTWHCVRHWLGTDLGTFLYLNQYLPSSMMPYDITNSLGLNEFNSLWPIDAIWQHRTGSTLAQVMTCYLMVTSHYYLNWCWLIISKLLWHSSEGIIMRRSEDTNQLLKSHPDLLGTNELIVWPHDRIMLICSICIA